MALNPKPFTLVEKIRKRLFNPKPSVFAHVDINQEAEVFVDAIERISERLGTVKENAALTVNSLSVSNIGFGWGTSPAIQFDIDIAVGYLYAKGTRFDIPATNLTTSGSAVFSFIGMYYPASNTPPEVTFVLAATKKTVLFTDDPVMSGIDGAGFPSPLASSDTEVWYNERILIRWNGALYEPSVLLTWDGVTPTYPTLPATVSLAADEEVVGTLFGFGFSETYNIYGGSQSPKVFTVFPIEYAPNKDMFNTGFTQGVEYGNTYSSNLLENVGVLWSKLKETSSRFILVASRLSALTTANTTNTTKLSNIEGAWTHVSLSASDFRPSDYPTHQFTSVGSAEMRYRVIGKTVYVDLEVTNLFYNTSPFNFGYLTLINNPASAAAATKAFSGSGYSSTDNYHPLRMESIQGSSVLFITPADANFTNSTTHYVSFKGSLIYEIV